MVMAAPAMLIVAPSGMDTAYVASSSFRRRQMFMLTGMLAAEERVKNAVTPDSRSIMKVSGYGFLRVQNQTMIGLITRATKSMQPRSTSRTCA